MYCAMGVSGNEPDGARSPVNENATGGISGNSGNLGVHETCMLPPPVFHCSKELNPTVIGVGEMDTKNAGAPSTTEVATVELISTGGKTRVRLARGRVTDLVLGVALCASARWGVIVSDGRSFPCRSTRG